MSRKQCEEDGKIEKIVEAVRKGEMTIDDAKARTTEIADK